MSIAFHGNYCGPGWSAGAYQSSVVSDVEATDAFDQTCKEHDAVYAMGGDLLAADAKFAYDNITSMNPKAAIAGLAVGSQGLLRAAYRGVFGSSDIHNNTINNNNSSNHGNMTKKKNNPTLPPLTKKEKTNLRKVIAEQQLLQDIAIKPNLKQKSRYLDPLGPSFKVATPPVSIGTTVTASKPVTKTIPNGVLVRGREFLCSVFESSNDNFQLSAVAPLHPAYYVASTMGQMARTYQRYRFRKLAIHFITRQPTTAAGQIALVYSAQINEPAEDGASGNFLPRVMTRGRASLGPIWQNHLLEVDCDATYRLIDPFSQADIPSHIFGEVQAYTLSDITDTAGYLLIDYELEFNTTMFAPHSTLIPLPSGPGVQFSLVDSSATPTAGDAVKLNLSGSLSSSTNGTIWRALINADESTLATGTTLVNAWQSTITYGLTVSTYGTTSQTLTIVDGMQVYIVVVGTIGYVYLTLEAAIAGDSTGQAFYRTTGSSAANWLMNSYIVQQPPVNQTRTQ